MNNEIKNSVQDRSKVCELCSSDKNINPFLAEGMPDHLVDSYAQVCETCKTQIEDSETIEPSHWRVLNESMWSEVPAVKVIAWRMLNTLKNESWTPELLEMMYIEEEYLEIAKSNQNIATHFDSNGHALQKGDSVVLIKDLEVKGANMIAKRGTAVRNISLSHENHNHIGGRVNGQSIIILTQYVKKNA